MMSRQITLALVMLMACGGLVQAQTPEGKIPSEAGALTGVSNPSFNLVNRAGVPIKELYFTPAGDATWGRNRLTAPIPAGGSYAARRRVDGNCIFDVRVVFADGRIEDRRGLNTCNIDDVAFGGGGAATAHKAADDPSFRLVNRGKAAIVEAYATPTGTGNWGQNRLDGGPIPPDADKVIHIEKQGTCSFDLRVVLQGGRTLDRRHADLCKITDLPVP
jgi:hypothetical protein